MKRYLLLLLILMAIGIFFSLFIQSPQIPIELSEEAPANQPTLAKAAQPQEAFAGRSNDIRFPIDEVRADDQMDPSQNTEIFSLDPYIKELQEKAKKEVEVFYWESWEIVKKLADSIKDQTAYQKIVLNWLQANEFQESPLIVGAICLAGAWSAHPAMTEIYYQYFHDPSYDIEIRKGSLTGLRLYYEGKEISGDSQKDLPISFEELSDFIHFSYFPFEFTKHFDVYSPFAEELKAILLDSNLISEAQVQFRCLAMLALGSEIDHADSIRKTIAKFLANSKQSEEMDLWEVAFGLLHMSGAVESKDLYWFTVKTKLTAIANGEENVLNVITISHMGDFGDYDYDYGQLIEDLDALIENRSIYPAYRLTAQRSLSRFMRRINSDDPRWYQAFDILTRQILEETEPSLQASALIFLFEGGEDTGAEVIRDLINNSSNKELRRRGLSFMIKQKGDDPEWRSFFEQVYYAETDPEILEMLNERLKRKGIIQ